MLKFLCHGMTALSIVGWTSLAAGMMKFVYCLPLSRATREEWSLWLSKASFWLCIFWSPWIRCRRAENFNESWRKTLEKMRESDRQTLAAGEAYKPLMMLCNHTSYFDTMLIVSQTPSNVLMRSRAYMTHKLFKIPILATFCKAVGHFPIYFTSDQDGVYKVDVARMESVEEKVDTHMQKGGWLMFFPEGAVNKNPDTILQFRWGGIKKALEKDARLVLFTCYGHNKIWPAKAAVGGIPGTTKYGINPIALEGARALVKQLRVTGGASKDADKPDHELLADHLRREMQGMYDEYKADVLGSGVAAKAS